MEACKKAIREYSAKAYRLITRDAVDHLPYAFFVPGSVYANQLWDWDSWLTDIAIRQIRTDNGDNDAAFFENEKGCILNFLAFEKEDGRIPIMVSSDNSFGESTSSENKFWQEDGNFHKPCLAQHLAFIVKETNEDVSWILPEFCKVERFVDAYIERCRHEKTGLYFWINDFAIGIDTDPAAFYRPERSSANIYLNCLMYKELTAMVYLCTLTGSKSAEKYRAEAEHLKAAMQEYLWDEKCGFYFSADLNILPVDPAQWLHSGMPRHWECVIERLDVWSGFMAMWAGVATKEQAERIVKENMLNEKTFCAPYGIRSLSKLEKMYRIVKSGNPSCWLGPIWTITNYMCFTGLLNYGYEAEAKELAEKTVKLLGSDILANGEMHEYYDPDTGVGVSNKGFQSWNLLANNMIAYLDGKKRISEF